MKWHFVYSPRERGRYHVFSDGAQHLGTVRRSADPVRNAKPWGYETPGRICDGGYPTRQAAAEGMVSFVVSRLETGR